MKKILFLLVALVSLAFADCNSYLDVTVNMVSYSGAGNDASTYQPPGHNFYREHDRLAIKSIMIENKGNLTIEASKIEISGKKPTDNFVISCDVPKNSLFYLNKDKELIDIKCDELALDEPGRYSFDTLAIGLANTTCDTEGLPHQVSSKLHLNDKTSKENVVFVKSLADVQALESNQLLLTLVIAAVGISIIFGLIALFYARKTYQANKHAEHEHEQALKSIAEGVQQSTKVQLEKFGMVMKKIEANVAKRKGKEEME